VPVRPCKYPVELNANQIYKYQKNLGTFRIHPDDIFTHPDYLSPPDDGMTHTVWCGRNSSTKDKDWPEDEDYTKPGMDDGDGNCIFGQFRGFQRYLNKIENLDFPLYFHQSVYITFKQGPASNGFLPFTRSNTKSGNDREHFVLPYHVPSLINEQLLNVQKDNVVIVLPSLEALSDCMPYFIAFLLYFGLVVGRHRRVSLICLGKVGGEKGCIECVVTPPLIWNDIYELIYFVQHRFTPPPLSDNVPLTKWHFLYDEMRKKQINQMACKNQRRNKGILFPNEML
jgi:hypothetical protein